MDPIIVTPPPVEPVTLTEIKQHIRIDFADDDALITSLITAARMLAETMLNRTLINTTYDWVMDMWPLAPLVAGGRYIQSLNTPPVPLSEIRISQPPLVSVTSIKYIDPLGVLQTIDPANYQVMAGTPGRILPAFARPWPVVRPWPGAITIRYTAGFGPDASTVPECVKAAIKIMVGGWYENREWQTDTGNNFGLVPMTVDALLAPLQWGAYT